MANEVIHFDIQADDPERAKAFYEKTFGWKIEKVMSADKGPFDYYGITTHAKGTEGINGGMMLRNPENKSRSFEATISVTDINKAVQDVKDNGGTITREPSELPGVGWFAIAKDTEGTNFNIMQPTDWKP